MIGELGVALRIEEIPEEKNSVYIKRSKVYQRPPQTRISSLFLHRATRLPRSGPSSPLLLHFLTFHDVLFSSGCYNKIPLTGCLKQQKFFSHNSRGWKVQSQGIVESDSGESSLLGLQKATFSLCPHMVESAGKLSFYMGTNPIMRAPMS